MVWFFGLGFWLGLSLSGIALGGEEEEGIVRVRGRRSAEAPDCCGAPHVCEIQFPFVAGRRLVASPGPRAVTSTGTSKDVDGSIK